MSVNEKMTAIADAIRESTGGTEPLTLDDMAQEIPKIYDAGYEKGKSEGGDIKHSDYINPEWTDWRYFSYYNNRNDLVAKLKYSDTSKGTNFSYMFSNCAALTEIPLLDTSKGINFKQMFYSCEALTEIPLIDTSNGTDFTSMFNGCLRLKKIPELDLSNGTNFSYMFAYWTCSEIYNNQGEPLKQLNTSKGTNFSYMFSNSRFTIIPEIDTSKGTSFTQMFLNNYSLKTIPKLNLSSIKSTSAMGSMFASCTALENVTFEGSVPVLGNISVLSPCKNLTVESLMSFINALSDNTGVSTTYTVTIGSTNLAKLTQEQIDIATAKNITLA